MTADSRAFFAADVGTATASVSLIARVERRWRLLGSLAAPAAIGADALAEQLVERLVAIDPDLAREIGLLGTHRREPASVTARTAQPGVAAVVAATTRGVAPLAAAASTAGWRARTVALDASDAVTVTRLIVDPAVDVVVLGAAEPPGGDDRSHLPELATLVGAAVVRRPELTVVFTGTARDHISKFEALAGVQRPGHTLQAPPVTDGDPPGEALRTFLDELRGGADDGRRGMIRSVATLAAVLERRIEVVEVGGGGGLRAVATPNPEARGATIRAAVVPAAALVPDDVPDSVVDGVMGWSTLGVDRLRLRDRLRELRVAPWSEPFGDGAVLRLAAARAALARLVEATPTMAHLPTPDVLLAAGGAWQVAPGSAVGLALADVLRRPGAAALALDHARLLGPLGTMADERERETLLSDLGDDLLAPLGSVIMPGGMRTARTAGRLMVHAAGGTSELELVPGSLELVDLPPGERAIVEFRFRETVTLGTRGRHFAVDVAGGLGGLLVDLRDVPLRLPERHDRRRELLAAWQRALWAGLEA
ncbi:MAG: hypothetical protein ACJ77N_13665 [Chloroflexota bacterium]